MLGRRKAKGRENLVGSLGALQAGDLLEDGGVEAMSWCDERGVGHQGTTQERQIPEEVEDLVARGFIRCAQPLGVDHTAAAEDNRVAQGAALTAGANHASNVVLHGAVVLRLEGADVDDQFFFTLGCRLSEADPSMLQDYAGDELALSEFLARVDLSQPKNLSQSEAILEIIRLMQQAAQKPKSSTK